eukprot:NODE_756_length_2121_cov_49.322322_g721_i0.p1 GENE.NODE_756_length_2121_cov_49.322322_g721_i0~~NODE_756_length_2121_cov_49.322322_g721_i0.p1  ORF type:complete len:404 (-),score=52.65 NODE_756_length_2121_cov_49.322322_g721_i0:616-1827(-)
MCGTHGTLYYLAAHSTDQLARIRTRGCCNSNANTAYTEQNILDITAFCVFILLPLFLTNLALKFFPMRWQDRMLRRPIATPATGCGESFNSYREMPLGVVLLCILFIMAVGAYIALWYRHFNQYYPSSYIGAGAIGRVTVYFVSVATFLGTRRVTWSWWFFKLPYERVLKVHAVVGTVAGIVLLVHGVLMFDLFNFSLPEHQTLTGFSLFIATIIMFPMAVIPIIRIKKYFAFKITHMLAPAITIVSFIHVISLNVDGSIPRGLLGSVIWTGVPAFLWIFDFIYTLIDMFAFKTTTIEGPAMLAADGDAEYVTLSVTKKARCDPGAWMSVTCFQAKSGLSHPFTAIVRDSGKADPFSKGAILDFVWKVNQPGSWTADVANCVKADRVPRFFVTGPFGGGLGGT